MAWNTFKSYLEARDYHDFQPETITKEQLNQVLKKFFVEVQKTDGTLYHKNTYTSIRFGLQRKFKELRTDIDIIEDHCFSECNNIFKVQMVQLRKNGLAKTNHKQPLNSQGVDKLYSSGVFSLTNPLALQRKVFFEVMLFLCRRGRENLRKLTKSSFAIKKDGKNEEYIELR